MSKHAISYGPAIVFIMMLVAASFAFNVGDYLYATETSANVQESTISAAGTAYTLYAISGRNAMLVSGNDIIQSQEGIAAVLNSNCFSTSYPSASDLDDIQRNATQYDASRNADAGMGPAEYRCIVTTGQNIVECVDTASCQAACSSAGITQGSCGRLLAGYGYPMVDSLLSYANARRYMAGNLTLITSLVSELKSVSSISQLTFNVSSKTAELYDAVSGLKSAGDNLLANKIFIHYSYGGYYLCIPPNLDTIAIDDAMSKASSVKTAGACFANSELEAANIVSNTADRVDYYLNVKQKASIAADFSSLMEIYNSITENVTNIITIFNAPEINESISYIENYTSAYYAYNSAQNYAAAGEQVNKIRTELDTLQASIAGANSAYATLGDSRDAATASVEKMKILVEANDAVLASEKATILNNYNRLEAQLAGKITYNDVQAMAEQYAAVTTQADALIAKKSEIEAGKVTNVFSDAARGVSLALLNAISDPLGVREEEKRTWMTIIPLMVISIFDIVLLAIIFLVFFFVVWNKTKVFLRAKVLGTWGLIFAFIIIVVLGLSFALNSLMTDAIGPTSYLSFASRMGASDSAYLFVEYSSSASTVSIADCADKVEAALTATGKTITKVNVIDGVCQDQLYSECLLQVGGNPLIKLKYASTNSSTFYTFYKIEGIIAGDAKYFNECAIADLIS